MATQKQEKIYLQKIDKCGCCGVDTTYYIAENEPPPRNDPVCPSCRKMGVMAVIPHSKLKKGK